jgi:2-oxoisovalerate dehydrogenase E1 component
MLFRFMQMSREVDRVEMELVNRGEGFFHVGGAGHESTVAVIGHLGPEDWMHPHYRDKALMLARGLPAEEFFHGLLATEGSASKGRQMCAHLSSPALKILTMAGPVGNSSLQSVGVAQELVARRQRQAPARNGSGRAGHSPKDPVVVCALGDSASQQGEFLEAVAEAVRSHLPVLFLVEDNGYGISTRTAGNTFYHLPSGPQSEFYGLTVHRMDGRDVLACSAALGPVVAEVRSGKPAIVVMEMERLTHHTNADDERVYRDTSELQRVRREADPIARLRDRLQASGVPEAELSGIEAEVEQHVRAAADRSLVTPNPVVNRDARAPAATGAKAPGPVAGSEVGETAPLTMLEAMREVLRRQLASDAAVSLFGEDIEDPKGDVFGLTRGLTRAFPGQVRNSALTESTILGVSVGRAMAGGRPVAFIQFADYLPLAFNQIAAELATVYWRSNGEWKSPVIVLAPCGGYRPGLGPFHSQTFDSTLAHLPGIDVVVPSTAADAAGLLNAAFANQSTGRPTVFLYPKVCLNDPGVATTAAALGEVVQPGKARIVRKGETLTLVGWGSTVPLCLEAARALEGVGVSAEVIDLLSLSPWDPETVTSSAEKTGRLIVVHEDNLTGGFGGEVVSSVVEATKVPVRCKRVARPDTHVPFNYLNQLELLPGLPEILAAAADLCDLDVSWESEEARVDGLHVLEAVGSSPADQTVSVVEWRVKCGDTIRAGDMIADCEADKATFELRAPVSGVIRNLLPVDEKVPVGSRLAEIQTVASDGPANVRRVPVNRTPKLTRRAGVPAPAPALANGPANVRPSNVFVPAPALGRDVVVGLSAIVAVPAGRVVTNEEMIQRFPGRTADDILQRTGIRSRRLLAPGESALSLAVTASRGALAGAGMRLSDLDAIFVCTSTPISISPSMACLVHHALSQDGAARDVAASDILAACTGYLYALQTAFDFCRSKPDANILVVTAEAMSEYTDPNDFDTAIVFGDAATATLIHGPSAARFGASRAHLHRPVLSARGEDGTILHHGRRGNPNVNMDGLKVFPMAVRQLIALLKQACDEGEIAVEDLDYIVPHQANGRILDAVDQRLKLPKGRLVNRVAHSGNTSSSTIPMVLAELLRENPKGKAGLCAFGGGFTFGAAVMEWV